ncbi:unnamed protein product [Cuscuta campestris]|uniref:Uncharacterized protein n=1 Tax=Cuscuta campestris TaxID=132261 RepID=A0A484LJQ3_9ASTE|nr:unnamed protein product [Cuscuta campestris]
MDGGGETMTWRRRRSCSKDDFLPKESFRDGGDSMRSSKCLPGSSSGCSAGPTKGQSWPPDPGATMR